MFYIWLEPEFHRAARSHLKIPFESMGIVDTSGCPESDRVLCHRLWAVAPCTVLKPVRVASRGLARP
jgi:hypothetical protein